MDQKYELLFLEQAFSDIMGKSMKTDFLRVIGQGFHEEWRSGPAPGDAGRMDGRTMAVSRRGITRLAHFIGSMTVHYAYLASFLLPCEQVHHVSLLHSSTFALASSTYYIPAAQDCPGSASAKVEIAKTLPHSYYLMPR